MLSASVLARAEGKNHLGSCCIGASGGRYFSGWSCHTLPYHFPGAQKQPHTEHPSAHAARCLVGADTTDDPWHPPEEQSGVQRTTHPRVGLSLPATASPKNSGAHAEGGTKVPGRHCLRYTSLPGQAASAPHARKNIHMRNTPMHAHAARRTTLEWMNEAKRNEVT